MKGTSSTGGKTKEKARTAHFRDDATDEGKTAYSRLTSPLNRNPNTTKNNNNNNNNNNQKTNKNKKQKTHTTKKPSYKATAIANGGSNSSLFATAPARQSTRINNSRKATLARHQGKGARKGSAQEIIFTHKTRFDVNFTLTANTIDGRTDELQAGIDDILNTFTHSDNSAKLLPWKSFNQAFHPAIENTNQTNASFTDIYLSRTWLGNMEKNHRAYFQIHMGHNEEYEDILPAFNDFNSHSDRNIQHSMLQAEDTSFIGWLLYSTINIDVGGLSDAIHETIGLDVGLRWMDIRMSNKGGKGKAKPVRAIHVEVEKSLSRKAMEVLMRHYGRKFDSAHDLPLGIRLRFCKNIDSAAYPKERTKLIRLRARQAQILDETRKTTTSGLLDLDAVLTPKEDKEDGPTTHTKSTTLRMAIMNIKSKTTKDTPLFNSVDIAYNSEEYVFAFHQSLAGEAKAMVDYLYPYLEHFYTPKSLKRAFDSMHIKEMTSFKYNISKDRVEDTVAEDAYSIIEEDNITGAIKFAAFDLSAMSIEDDDNGERPAASILGKMYGDSDSISTQNHGRVSKTTIPQNADILEVTEEELMEIQRRTLLHTQSKDKQSARKDTLHIQNLDTKTMLAQIRRDNLHLHKSNTSTNDNSSHHEESSTNNSEEIASSTGTYNSDSEEEGDDDNSNSNAQNRYNDDEEPMDEDTPFGNTQQEGRHDYSSQEDGDDFKDAKQTEAIHIHDDDSSKGSSNENNTARTQNWISQSNNDSKIDSLSSEEGVHGY
jgi:hypothetical protein